MTQTTKPRFEILADTDPTQENTRFEGFLTDVLLGLTSDTKRLHSKYIYDNEGSRLFSQIMELEEYYPTRCEKEILENHKEYFAALAAGEPFNLVELGAGDGRKTKILLKHFLEKDLDFQYIPIDISEEAIKGLLAQFAEAYPGLEMKGLVAEYFRGLRWLKNSSERRNFVLFMGSNIGNFNLPQAGDFLRSLWNSLHDGDLVAIGFDLQKDLDTLRSAYNDSKGVTAQFNLNLLKRINRELGGEFDLDNFRFYSTYNPNSGAIESFLISLKEQEVHIAELDRSFTFHKWEPIHTEYSFKYNLRGVEQLAASAGFKIEKHLTDSQGYFLNSLWRVRKDV
ncbi:MAG: L-histidine N(alpha)-methyltransferase [Bacteroidia bacterium]